MGVTGYEIYRNDAPLTTVGGNVTTYTDQNVAATVPYSYTVKAVDARRATSPIRATRRARRCPTPRSRARQTNLVAAATASKVDLTWGASGDNVAVTGYNIYRDGTPIATLGVTTSYSDTSVTAPGYNYDGAGARRGRQPLRPQQQGDGDRARRPEAHGARHPERDRRGTEPGQPHLGGVERQHRRHRLQGLPRQRPPDRDPRRRDLLLRHRASPATPPTPTRSAPLTPPATSPTRATPPRRPRPRPRRRFTLRAGGRRARAGLGRHHQLRDGNLRVDGGTNPAVESFLRFTVTGAPAGTVRSAKLRVYAYSGTVDGPAVFTTNPAWTETAINWNNRPPRTSADTDDKGASRPTAGSSTTSRSFVTGNGTFSFGLAGTSSDGVDFYSREAATLRPELVVTTGAPDTQKPTRRRAISAQRGSASQVDLALAARQRQRRRDRLPGLPQRHRPDRDVGVVTTAYSDTTVAANTHLQLPGARHRRRRQRLRSEQHRDGHHAARGDGDDALPRGRRQGVQAGQRPPPTTATAYLRANGGTEPDVESFLRFTVTGASARDACRTPSCASTTTTAPSDGPAVYTTDTSGARPRSTGTRRPARTSAATDDKGAIRGEHWVEYNVTPFVTGTAPTASTSPRPPATASTSTPARPPASARSSCSPSGNRQNQPMSLSMLVHRKGKRLPLAVGLAALLLIAIVIAVLANRGGGNGDSAAEPPDRMRRRQSTARTTRTSMPSTWRTAGA